MEGGNLPMTFSSAAMRKRTSVQSLTSAILTPSFSMYPQNGFVIGVRTKVGAMRLHRSGGP